MISKILITAGNPLVILSPNDSMVKSSGLDSLHKISSTDGTCDIYMYIHLCNKMCSRAKVIVRNLPRGIAREKMLTVAEIVYGIYEQ